MTNLSQISLATDNVFSDGADLETPTITGDVDSGYVVSDGRRRRHHHRGRWRLDGRVPVGAPAAGVSRRGAEASGRLQHEVVGGLEPGALDRVPSGNVPPSRGSYRTTSSSLTPNTTSESRWSAPPGTGG